MKEHAKLVCVKIFSNEEEAQIARGLLESNGFEAMVSTAGEDPAREGYVLGNGVKLLVRREDINQVSKMLAKK